MFMTKNEKHEQEITYDKKGNAIQWNFGKQDFHKPLERRTN